VGGTVCIEKAAAEPPHSKGYLRIILYIFYKTSHSAEERRMGHPSAVICDVGKKSRLDADSALEKMTLIISRHARAMICDVREDLGGDEFFYYGDWQGAFVEDAVVEFEHVEVRAGRGLIFFSEGEPLAQAYIVGGELSRA
jgi:hypothetical protein